MPQILTFLFLSCTLTAVIQCHIRTTDRSNNSDSALLHLAIANDATCCGDRKSLRPELWRQVTTLEKALMLLVNHCWSLLPTIYPTSIDVITTLHSTSTLITQKIKGGFYA